MNKYKVIYRLMGVESVYGYYGPVGEYSVEFLAQDGFSYEVADSLKPNNPYNFTWMIDQIFLLEESKL